MKTIGEVISQHRHQQGWSLERLAKETQVPLECLEALEADRFAQLPTMALVQGYVQLIAQALHIPSETALALLRRDLPQPPARQSLWSRSERSPLGSQRWWRPQLFSVGLVILLALSAVLFLGYQWQRLTDVPRLEVENLQNNTIVKAPIEISGQTNPNVTITINTEIVSLDPQGRFRYLLDLPQGERTIVIQATDARGRQNEAVFFVTVE